MRAYHTAITCNHTKRPVTLHRVGPEGRVPWNSVLPVGIILILVALGALASAIGADGRDDGDEFVRHITGGGI